MLFGKYRLERVIGTGRSGTVWLAVHLGLEEYRAIKCMLRRGTNYETVRREAMILKNLRHPAIPIVYDLEEDSDYLYLVEEYLQGTSLYTLVRKQGVMWEAEAVRYGIQLCQLVQFLHSAGETPILHLDLQPNNLMVCEGTLKIIDFGQAVYEGRPEEEERRAVRGFAAPEQYCPEQSLDTRADLYGVGALLAFMVSGTPDPALCRGKVSSQLERIIVQCMEKERDKRFGSAEQVERCLWTLLESDRGKRGPRPSGPMTIAVAGSRPGAGATHLALALSRYLSESGIEALYMEENQSGHMRCMARTLGLRPDEAGIYHMAGCQIRPWYGETVALKPIRPAVFVYDYGDEWKRMYDQETSSLIMVSGSSSWERWDLERMLEALGPKIAPAKGSFLVFKGRKREIFGFCPESVRAEKKTYKGMERLFQPYFSNPFRPGEQGEAFLKELWRAVKGAEEKQISKEGRRGTRRLGEEEKGWRKVLGDRIGKGGA